MVIRVSEITLDMHIREPAADCDELRRLDRIEKIEQLLPMSHEFLLEEYGEEAHSAYCEACLRTGRKTPHEQLREQFS